MAERTLLIELSYQPTVAEAAFAAALEPEAEPDVAAVPTPAGVRADETFSITQIRGERPREQTDDPYDISALVELTTAPEESTYVARVVVDEEKLDASVDRLRKRSEVVGVYADPVIEPTIVCPGDPAVGSDADVERLLCTSELGRLGADGTGVLVAIVDTGFNVAYLNAHGKTPTFDAARSWVPRAGLIPGSLPVSHGTMCAFDVCIAAPRCTLLDIAVLQSTATGPTAMSGVLSDAVRAYSHLLTMMTAASGSGRPLSLVVNNSWGMFDPAWDFPVGDPGNYSDNPNHPFNRIVGSLERAGADILFAAGNCGPDCPDGRCRNIVTNAIYGANGHGLVLCVAGVDVTKARVGYSTVGPGRLTRNKPDICGYTHFRGSGVYAADGGTSAATPVVAGVVAAVRSKRPFSPSNASTSPAAIRTLMTSSAEDLGSSGYDFQHGYGVVSGCRLAERLGGVRPQPIDLCRRYPWLCRWDLCRRYPWLCRPFPFPWPLPLPNPPFPPIPPGPEGRPAGGTAAEVGGAEAVTPGVELEEAGGEDPVVLSYLAGLRDGKLAVRYELEQPSATSRSGGCGCR